MEAKGYEDDKPEIKPYMEQKQYKSKMPPETIETLKWNKESKELHRKLEYHETVLQYVKNTLALIDDLHLMGFTDVVDSAQFKKFADDKLFMFGYHKGVEHTTKEAYEKGYQAGLKHSEAIKTKNIEELMQAVAKLQASRLTDLQFKDSKQG